GVHFTPQTENLIRGVTAPLEADIAYTLRVFPNHHRALDAMSRLSVKLHTLHPPKSDCSVDGWFERAIRFRPDDARVHLAYGIHHFRWKRLAQAKEQLLEAERLAGNDSNVFYNLGLLYADLKEWDKAMSYAKKAYDSGFPLPGL